MLANLAKTANMAKLAILAKFWLNFAKVVNLFVLIISSTPWRLVKSCQNRHFRQIRRFRQLYGAILTGLIYLLWSFR